MIAVRQTTEIPNPQHLKKIEWCIESVGEHSLVGEFEIVHEDGITSSHLFGDGDGGYFGEKNAALSAFEDNEHLIDALIEFQGTLAKAMDQRWPEDG